jgi:hypothetical protein
MMRKTTRYVVAASTIVVITMIGSSFVSAKVINPNTDSTIEIASLADLDTRLPQLKGNNIRHKLKHIRERMDNSALLDVLNITPSEFKSLRIQGKTLKEIVDQKGIDLEKVKEVVEKQMIEKWERLLSNGIINQEKYDDLVSEKETILEKHLNADGSRLVERFKQ